MTTRTFRPLVDRFELFLNEPIRFGARIILAALVLPLALSFTQPLWRIQLQAPQYPAGLHMDIYTYRLEGGHAGHDIEEINELNHYIGMQHIDRASFEDLDWLPFAIGVLAILALRTAVIGNVRTLIDLVVITGYVSVFAFARFVYKLYVFGHYLDQKAALRIPPFMPAVLGTKQIANFATESLPSWGSGYLAIFATGTAALALWHLVAGYRAAWRKPAAALLASSAIIAGGCGTSAMGPAPLDTAHATCAACRMGVADRTVASEIVVPGDDPRFFDDLGCLARYLAENPLPAGARVYVADHRTSAWLPADRAVYVRTPDVMAAMGSHVLAYDSAESVHLDPAAAGGSVVAHDAVFRGN